jgi:spindle assembly abnormal protein 6
VQLTDESYPNFLYTMRMSEEDFESFKLDQGILVDFDEFPERVTDLLKFCTSTGQAALGLVKGNSAKSTKFAVSLVAGSASTNLQIVETNEFRTIVHLRLDMRPCNLPVCLYRKYLTEELAKTRSERDRLRVALNQKISEARKAEEADTVQLSETVDREAELNLQIEHLKTDIAQWKTTYTSSKKNLEAEIARAYAANSKYKELTAAQRARIEDIEALLSESVEQLGLFSHESVELRFELEVRFSIFVMDFST